MSTKRNQELVAKLAAMSTAELIRAAAPGVFAGGGYGLISGGLNPGHDESGNRKSALSQAIKRSLMGAIIGGSLTARYPQGIPATANMMHQGLDAVGNTIRQLRDNTTGNEIESLIYSLITGDR